MPKHNDKRKVCTCNAYPFPHKKDGGKCGQEHPCTCVAESDPFGTGDRNYMEFDSSRCQQHNR
jgi:hypothetical protein